jgi:hypothetical protein
MMPPATMMWLGAAVTSVLCSLAFIVALLVSYMSKDQPNLGLLIGAVIANFSTTVSFWLGSSAGSQKKDETLAAR